MPLPELTVGLVVRYEYIWARRASKAETADRDHPARVVATFRRQGKAEEFVVYLPISLTQPTGDEEGFELTDHAKLAAGLDGRRQWVLVSECNIDAWPIDIRQLPRQPGRFYYGHLPPIVFRAIRDRFSERYQAKRVRQIGRETPYNGQIPAADIWLTPALARGGALKPPSRSSRYPTPG